MSKKGLLFGRTEALHPKPAAATREDVAGHADPCTTKRYDRRRQLVTQSEVERIRYERKQS